MTDHLQSKRGRNRMKMRTTKMLLVAALVGATFVQPGGAALATHTIDPQMWVTPQTFYPRVQDGFKDKTSIEILDESDTGYFCALELVIRNSKNAIVHSDSRAWAACDRYDVVFTWDGRRDSDNRLVAEGRYNAAATASYDDGDVVVTR